MLAGCAALSSLSKEANSAQQMGAAAIGLVFFFTVMKQEGICEMLLSLLPLIYMIIF